ncbi:hypothetical protein Tco_0749848 [Tanacetum coccineum]|uniref:Retrovirus-related Pol polyprotein from transposon TNT 1-94 n=1 Tax=Tanacetum coccineum TaxID=301880 RepID=A0ABQ4Z2N7_9ASTR
MSTFIKNQSSWKLSQLKKLSFEKLKTEFEKLMKSIESFVPMETEARVKRHRLQLEQEQETSKKQKIDIEDASITKGKDEVVKEEETEVPVKKTRMRMKQKARKGINIDKTAQDEEREAYVKDKVKDASLELEIGVDVIPTTTKPPTIVNWKIISQSSQKATYQIIRKDGSDKIYMSFGAILKDFSRDDLIKLYRLVIKKYGAYRPKEMYDRVLWGDLKTMFDPPLNRKYHLSKDVCQVMLKMKLLDGTMDEVCYQLLKMIEKQAGIRKQNKGQGNYARGAVIAGNGGVQNRVSNANPGQAKSIKYYNCNGIGHITRQCTYPKRPQNLEYFKDNMLLMQAQENRVVLDEEQLLFIAGGQTNTFDNDVDEAPVQDLVLNKDNIFQDDQCDAFDSDDILSEVQDHDNYIDSVGEYHEVHEMQNDVQPSYVVDSDAEYTSDSNIILYEQYVKDNAEQVVQSNNKVVNESLTAELARYKEQVELYEKRARLELTEREQKIDEQLRIIITNRNYKEESLKRELHSVKMQLNSTIKHNKSMIEECLQTVYMLCKPKPYYDEKKKVAIGYKNPLHLTSAMQVQSALYNGHEIVKTNHAPAVVHDSEDTLEIGDITRNRMLEKVKSPLCVEKKVKFSPPDYSKENYLATFTPQRYLTA